MGIRLGHKTPPEPLYERVGGMVFFTDLVEAFYVGVQARPVLRAMYPEDLAESKDHLALFLAQYFGGPATYNEVRGHPRLKMRHSPYVIDVEARDLWLSAMLEALDMVDPAPEIRGELAAYLDMAAHQLRNA